jgi:hypothetical protein
LNIPELSNFDNVIVGTYPLAILAEFNRFTSADKRTTWLGEPFNNADSVTFRKILRTGKTAIIYSASPSFNLAELSSRLGVSESGPCKQVKTSLQYSPDGNGESMILSLCPVLLNTR